MKYRIGQRPGLSGNEGKGEVGQLTIYKIYRTKNCSRDVPPNCHLYLKFFVHIKRGKFVVIDPLCYLIFFLQSVLRKIFYSKHKVNKERWVPVFLFPLLKFDVLPFVSKGSSLGNE